MAVRMPICGDITHLLPGLAQLPINIIDVDHMVDLETVRKTLPNHVAIVANLDPVVDLLLGSPKSNRTEPEGCYRAGGNPFIANAGCEVPPGAPPANLMALSEPLAVRS